MVDAFENDFYVSSPCQQLLKMATVELQQQPPPSKVHKISCIHLMQARTVLKRIIVASINYSVCNKLWVMPIPLIVMLLFSCVYM